VDKATAEAKCTRGPSEDRDRTISESGLRKAEKEDNLHNYCWKKKARTTTCAHKRIARQTDGSEQDLVRNIRNLEGI